MADRSAVKKLRPVGVSTDGATSWPQVETTTLADRVYIVLRNMILQRELAPGTFIREQEVSRAIGVSRTPVREALSRLASQDFLERVPHRGFRIPDRPFDVLIEVYPIINTLEVLAVKLSIDKITDADIEEMKRLNHRLAEAVDVSVRVESNKAFHKILSDRSGNSRLAELLDQLRSQVVNLDAWHFSKTSKISQSVAEHAAIIAALEERDLAATIESLKANYSRARLELQAELDAKAHQLGS
jgi:DNA-binding GntR family transcriptional regulator